MIGRRKILVQALPLIIAAVILLRPATAWLQEQPQEAQELSGAPAAETPPQPDAARDELALPAPAPADEGAAGRPATYRVKEGDTLWDISSALFQDPFLWPLLWKSNPSIANPDLIYPGNILTVPSLAPVERAMAAPPEAPVETALEEESPAEAPPAEEPVVPEPEEPQELLVMPEETSAPLVDKYTMVNAGFVNEVDPVGEILSAADGKQIIGYDDVVYISLGERQDVAVGDRFLIYKPLHVVKHPITKERVGRLTKILGILKITEIGREGTYTARLTLSFDAAEPGDLLTPYEEPTLLYDADRKKNKDISAVILEVTDRRTINAQTDIVYLDKGRESGVEPGDRFTVYAEAPEPMATPRQLGEVQVFLVKEHTSTGLVRKSVDVIVRGERLEYKKP